MKSSALMLLAALATAEVGCTSYQVSGPGSYSHEGVIINPQTLALSGSKLRLRFVFINHTESEILVDRNQMSLRFPDGQVASRFTGTWGGMTSGMHKIPPGGSHNVFMDFRLDGDPPSHASLVLTGVVSDGKPMDLPDYEIDITQE